MTDEKKEVCWPLVKDDIRMGLMILGGLGIVVVIGVLFLWYIPVFIGEYAINFCARAYSERVECNNFDYFFTGFVLEAVGFCLLYIIFASIFEVYKRYWITEKDCYDKTKEE